MFATCNLDNDLSIWTRISEGLAAIATSAPVSGLMDTVVNYMSKVSDNPERRQATFTIAMIALAAKMAKADGVVTPDEIDAFKDLFEIPQAEQRNVARIYNLAKQDVAGFDAYARQIAEIYAEDGDILEDIVDGLFHIAVADGVVHENELAFLDHIAEIFKLSDSIYEALKARHVYEGDADPYLVLGIERDASFDEIKKHYRKLVGENHPDLLIARGVPEEFLRIANEKIAAINAAFDVIEKQRS